MVRIQQKILSEKSVKHKLTERYRYKWSVEVIQSKKKVSELDFKFS